MTMIINPYRFAASGVTVLASEDFESGAIGSTILTAGSSTYVVGTTYARTGTYGLVGGQAGVFRSRYTSVSYSAGGFFLEGWVRPSVPTATNITGLFFGGQDVYGMGYGAMVDPRNGTGNSAGFHLREDVGATLLNSDDAVVVSSETWYRVTVEWATSGTIITAKLYNTAGTLLSTLTSNDTTYTSGGIGFLTYDLGWFDELALYDAPPA